MEGKKEPPHSEQAVWGQGICRFLEQDYYSISSRKNQGGNKTNE